MLKFIDPIDGVILHTAGAQDGGIDCVLTGGRGQVWVNGVPCARSGSKWTARVPIPLGGRTLTARDEGGSEAEIAIGRVHTKDRLYRLSIDDAVWCLQDVARNAARYLSVFDNPYLKLMRRLHEDYGTKVHMNIYLTCPERGGFSLSEMPDKFRDEWQANRDWLRLGFHARANDPDWPYVHSGYDELRRDCSAVMGEIRRFAGEMGCVTTLHFADTPREGVRALRDCGVRALLGDFALDGEGNEYLCYGHRGDEFRAVRRYGFWRDPETDMIFFPCDIVLNTLLPEEIGPALDAVAAESPLKNFTDILMHEQYFYADYPLYEADYEARLRAGIEWCRDRGYAPGLAADVLDAVTGSFQA